MCCSGAQWKREEVPDHKWDFIDVREFHNSGCLSYLRYCFLYVLIIKSVGVYCADIYTMVLLLASNHWAGSILEASGGSSAVQVPFSIGKWIFFGCIIFSFLLLAWEARKSRAIIRSRDISYAFTNVMANNYYSLKSYDHFCFFSNINNSKKKKDDFAFFIFFTFKGWKRLLLADAPRQVINGLTLYSFARSVHFSTNISDWYSGSFAKATVLITMIFTVVIWIGSFLLLLIAAIMYIPLLCYIQGNLKEYCCHKVDKRIAELMKRKTRKRLAKEAAIMRKEAMGDFSHLKDKKTGKMRGAPMPQPTLPQVGLEDLMDDGKSEYGGSRTGVGAGPGAYGYPPTLPYSNSGHGLHPSQSMRWAGGEKEYGSEPKYAESIASTDQFMANQAPMAGHHQQHQPYNLQRQATWQMSRAPSYETEDYGHGTEYAKSDFHSLYGGQEDGAQDRPPMPPPPQQYYEQQARGHEGRWGSHPTNEVDVASSYYGEEADGRRGGGPEEEYGYEGGPTAPAPGHFYPQHQQHSHQHQQQQQQQWHQPQHQYSASGGRSGYI